MLLTDNLKKGSFWREAGNRFFIEIDGKPVELKYTLAQNLKYKEFLKEQKEVVETAEAGESLEKLLIDQIENSIDNSVNVLFIALNSKREEVVYDRDKILDIFSERIDLLKIVSKTYVANKIFNPSLSKVLDPLLAPGV
jgi:hypothetical protein